MRSSVSSSANRSQSSRVQFDLAEMAVDVEATRLMVYNAARLHDSGRPFLTEAAMCKYFASQVAERVASRAVEILGGVQGLRKTIQWRSYTAMPDRPHLRGHKQHAKDDHREADAGQAHMSRSDDWITP